MALCRCIDHQPRNKEKYTNSVNPIGYPNTSSICGIGGCLNPGLIWLTKNEYRAFTNETRIFNYSSNTTKVQVEI